MLIKKINNGSYPSQHEICDPDTAPFENEGAGEEGFSPSQRIYQDVGSGSLILVGGCGRSP